MNELIKEEKIEEMIYEIRGKQVMLDSDLAKLYQCANGTKAINLAVKRHINRFPERFMFRLNKEEYNDLRFHFETANNMSRSLPYAFTEQGVAMLATILRTNVAEQISIKIMDAFVAMRHYIGNSEYRLSNVETKVLAHDNDIKLLQAAFNKFDEKQTEIYFSGQTFDAYARIINILKNAKKELIIIDRYADISLLDIVKNLACHIILITKKNNKLSHTDVIKYNEQYHNLTIYYNDTFHDRYFILDRSKIYQSGTSINYAGTRTFSINILSDVAISKALINNLDEIIKNNQK